MALSSSKEKFGFLQKVQSRRPVILNPIHWTGAWVPVRPTTCFMSGRMARRFIPTNVNGGTVSILTAPEPRLNLPTWATATAAMSGRKRLSHCPGSEGFDVSPDGQELWTASSDNGQITIIDLSAKSKVHSLTPNPRGKPAEIHLTVPWFSSPARARDAIIFDAKTRKEINDCLSDMVLQVFKWI